MLSLLLIHLSHAVPLQFNHQGRLLDLAGEPITGEHELVFRIYDEATNGTVQWQEILQTEFVNGYYSVNLGEDEENNALDSSILANYPLWIELTIDSDTMEPRYPMQSVPYSRIAGVAESVEGGTVNADEVSIHNDLVIDSDRNWVGEPISWNDLSDIPEELTDGDENTQLSETEVEGYITNESIDLAAGSSVSGHAILTTADTLSPMWNDINARPPGLDDGDDDTQLSEGQVEGFITNDAIDFSVAPTVAGLDIVTTDLISCSTGDLLIWDGTLGGWFCEADALSTLAVNCSSGQVLKLNANSGAWECENDTDTILSAGDVIGFVETSDIVSTGTICDSNGCIGDKQWAETGSDLYYDSGNVGIGVTAPTSTLEVAGVIESTTGGVKFPDGTTQTSAAGSGYHSVWTYQNGVHNPSTSVSFDWITWVNDRLAEGSIKQSTLYQCNMTSNNTAHYSGFSFKLAVNINSSQHNYNQYHRVFDIQETHSGWIGGCGYALTNFTTSGFTYTSTCGQSIDCRCIVLN